MNLETTRVTRGIVALGLGYFATITVDWVALQSMTFPGSTELYVLGAIYLLTSITAFIVVSAAESYAIGKGFPVSRASDVGYELATVGVLWAIGGSIGYVAMQSLYPGSGYALPVTVLAGLVGVVVGELLLWTGRSEGDRSTNAR